MKAITWHGKSDLRCESVPDPKIEHPNDAIIKVTACAICGSDLHIFNGIMPGMEAGDVLGHETMKRMSFWCRMVRFRSCRQEKPRRET